MPKSSAKREACLAWCVEYLNEHGRTPLKTLTNEAQKAGFERLMLYHIRPYLADVLYVTVMEHSNQACWELVTQAEAAKRNADSARRREHAQDILAKLRSAKGAGNV